MIRLDARAPKRAELRLALPVKGRLADPTRRLFNDAGVDIATDDRRLHVVLDDHDLEILLARSEDIPVWVEDRAVDVGVAGRNQVLEAGVQIDERLALGYGQCRLQVAVPSDSDERALTDLAGKRIATSYPRTVASHLASRGVTASLIPISGSVELAPALGAAEAIADLVTSGETLRQNGLIAIDTIVESEAVLVAPPHLEAQAERRVTELVTVLASVLEARPKRYLMLNAPDASLDAVLRLLPGLDAPTVVPLARQGMHAVHAVVAARDLTRLLAPLKRAGASGILVLPIEHLVA